MAVNELYPALQPANYGGAPQSTTPSPSQTPQVGGTSPGLINGVSNSQYQNVDGVYRTVQSNETVQGQLQGIIAQDSPLLRQARSKAMEGMKERGLVNSSMAQSAGQDAMYKSALQVATPDAVTYSQAAHNNQVVGNETNKFNAEAFNKSSEFNAGANNEMGLRQEADRADMERTKLTESGQTARNAATNATSIKTQGMQDATQVATTGMNNEVSKYTANLDATNRMAVQESANRHGTSVEQMRQTHATTLESSKAANDIMLDLTRNSTAILTNPDLDGPAREAHLNNLLVLTNVALDIAGTARKIP